jgi:hypothetical protein
MQYIQLRLHPFSKVIAPKVKVCIIFKALMYVVLCMFIYKVNGRHGNIIVPVLTLLSIAFFSSAVDFHC